MNLADNLTVLVLSYNRADLLSRCLASLQHQGRIVVVDNGSEEKNVSEAAAAVPWVSETIRLDPNRGFAGAYNAAIAHVSTPYVALVSNDTVMRPGCMSHLVHALEQVTDAGVVAPLILDGSGMLQEAGWTMDFFGFPIEARQTPEACREVFYASGCVLAMKTSDFISVGGFSEHFRFFAEDLDLCWKLRLSGKKVLVVAAALAEHDGGATLSGASYVKEKNVSSLSRTFYRERNVPLAFFQNFGILQVLYRFPVMAMISAFEALGMLLSGQFAVSKQYARAWLGFWCLLGHAIRARRLAQCLRKVPDSEILRFFSNRNRKLELVRERGLPVVSPR